MIQFIFESTGKLIPEWEHEEERVVFRLAPVNVSCSKLLHGRLDEAGETAPDGEALSMVVTQYEGDIARRVRVILELPDDVWDDLADRADALLDQEPAGQQEEG